MKQKLLTAIREFIVITLCFGVVFTLLRAFETALVASRLDSAIRGELIGFLYDWPFVLSIAFFVLWPYAGIRLLNARAGRIFIMSAYTLVIAAGTLLTRYFSITLIPLSTDVFGYSLNDIGTTIRSSGGADVVTIVGLALYLTAFVIPTLWLVRKKPKHELSEKIVWAVPAVLFVFMMLNIRLNQNRSAHRLEHYVTANKTQYFISQTFASFMASVQSPTGIGPASYPFRKEIGYPDVLGSYINTSSDHPHFVFILVEGLGGDFVGQDAAYGGFTPFLDSLAQQSLYWKNALSNAGRTFGVLPSILGSLPYGKEGFMSYGTRMPQHQTLISLLKPHRYTANFFYGGNPNFDNQDIFMEYQGTDYMLDESKFPAAYKKANSSGDDFTWGYPDRDVFNYSLEVLREQQASPRVNVYLTLSTHEPFKVPEPIFGQIFEQRLDQSGWPEEKKKKYRDYKNIFSCLLYTDDVLRKFFDAFRKRPEFTNAIFVITGDHRLIPIPPRNRLSRFHVPLLIYSPQLKQPKSFGALVTHAQVTPTLLAFLSARYDLEFPDKLSFIAGPLSVDENFSSVLDLALIRTKNEIIDYVEGEQLLSNNHLFRITPGLDLEPLMQDSIRERLQKKLELFNAKSVFACENNMLDSGIALRQSKLFKFTFSEIRFIEVQKLDALMPDGLFFKARDLALSKQYGESRTVAKYLLNRSPNYHDARILLARTFAWSGQYDSARFYLQQVLGRSPAYADAYVACADVEFWDGRHEEALLFARSGLKVNPGNADLLAREARALWNTGKKDDARKIVQHVLTGNPQHELALDLQAKMRQ
ncbi:MAG: sulfatase-like hydrolase/transferase [Bacteroidota bacterium]